MVMKLFIVISLSLVGCLMFAFGVTSPCFIPDNLNPLQMAFWGIATVLLIICCLFIVAFGVTLINGRVRGILVRNVEIRECKDSHYVEDVNNFHPVVFKLEIVNKTGLQLSLIKQVTSITYCGIPAQLFSWDRESRISSSGVEVKGLVVGGKQNSNVKVIYNPHMSVLSLPPSNSNWGLAGRLVFNTIYGNISKDFSLNDITIPNANKWGQIRAKLNDFNKQK